MTHRVLITPSAENELRTLHRYPAKHAPRAAGDWIRGMRLAVKTLSQNPERAHPAPESISLSEPIREPDSFRY